MAFLQLHLIKYLYMEKKLKILYNTVGGWNWIDGLETDLTAEKAKT